MHLKELIDKNFIQYASYVIRDRAIPHIDDGMKPVQRRILHALWEMDDGRFSKVANVIGQTMRFHPHGDASIGDALVNLANREFFIDRQGNFGNLLTGDEASAARYIECRLTPLAREVLFNPDLTEMVDSYDGRSKEPVTLPAKVPALLMMGADGIAVGLSTRIIPHNFRELLEAQIALLRGETARLVPDFPQGGFIDARDYDDGLGRVKVRALIESRSSKSLIIREIPFSTTTESLIASIEDAARKGKIKISQINDFTSDQVEIEVIPGRGISAEELEPALYAFTDCEVSVSVNPMVIHEARPRRMSVSEILWHNTIKLRGDLEKELRIELDRLGEKEHRKTLVQIFIENRIYKEIEEKKSADAVAWAIRDGLAPFRAQLKRDVSDEDVDMLLEIPIRRISRFDIEKSREEIREIQARMRKIGEELGDMTGFTVNYINGLLAKYAKDCPRRTRIQSFETVEAREVALANVKVRYDEAAGYLGTDVKDGRLISLSPYDKLMVIRADGTYKITGIPKKVFVGENALYLDVYYKDVLFNLIYREKKSAVSFVKRFNVGQFILDKEYPLFEKGGVIQAFSTGPKFAVKVFYRKKPRLKVTDEVMDFADMPPRAPSAKGNRVSPKEVARIRILEGKAEKDAAADKATLPIEPIEALESGDSQPIPDTSNATQPKLFD